MQVQRFPRYPRQPIIHNGICNTANSARVTRHSAFRTPHSALRTPHSAFTLLELLIVIGIIVLLIGILIPTISRVRIAAKQADTRAQLGAIAAACENYYGDFRAYPGPFSNAQLANNTVPNMPPPAPPLFDAQLYIRGDASTYPGATTVAYVLPATPTAAAFTSSENLVLGLLGGLVVDTSFTPHRMIFDPTLIGKGPNSVNPANLKHSAAYMDATNLSLRVDDHSGSNLRTGKYGDDSMPLTGPNAGGCADSVIPEFMDRFADPMPILYQRAATGRSSASTPESDTDNSIVIDGSGGGASPAQYELSQFIPYTGAFTPAGTYDPSNVPATTCKSIGVGRQPAHYIQNGADVGTPSFTYHGLRTVRVNSEATSKSGVTGSYYPLPAFPYLRNPSVSGTAPNTKPNVTRQKDGFILISAGTDRIYGTADDITNFGDVLP